MELYEKNLILADKLLENLLRGQELNRSDLRLLQLHMPYYRVICAPLHKVHNICDIIERNAVGSPIYAIEMYMDGVLAFVCGLPDDSQASLEKLLEAIRALVANADVPLGYSPACASPKCSLPPIAKQRRLFLQKKTRQETLCQKPPHSWWTIRQKRKPS